MWSPPSATNTQRARRLRTARFAAYLAVLAAFGVWVGSAQNKTAPAKTKDAKPAELVGSETCAGCHEDISKAFQKNPHRAVETDAKFHFAEKACESCHGGGSKHAESLSAADIRNPGKIAPAEVARVCLTCHANQSTHAGRIMSGHDKNAVSCTACHSIHKNGPEGLVARKPADVNKQCAGCHTDVWASFQRQYKHRLPEGAMTCVDCHNPHGGSLPRGLQTTAANEPGCLKCHGDLAGPFTFEHAPVRMEGCTACHQPHGSDNPKMLTRAEVRMVCLECHANLPLPTVQTDSAMGSIPPSVHDLRSPRFRNCTVCHQKIHGSYADRGLQR
jgi:DmsE family decaheme c-type cytochrome